MIIIEDVYIKIEISYKKHFGNSFELTISIKQNMTKEKSPINCR